MGAIESFGSVARRHPMKRYSSEQSQPRLKSRAAELPVYDMDDDQDMYGVDDEYSDAAIEDTVEVIESHAEPSTDKHQAIIPITQHKEFKASLQIEQSAPAYACSICKDAGYTVVREPFPSWKSTMEPCACKKEELKQKRQEKLIEKSGVLNIEGATFDTFELVSGCNEAKDLSEKFADYPYGFLVLIGTTGCGKTHLAQAIAHARINAGDLVSFQTVPDLLDELRSTFGKNSELTYSATFEEMKSAPVAVFDDYGAESMTPWANEKMYQLINYRYVQRLPTVITTNVGLDAFDFRIKSRLRDRSKVKVVLMNKAEDYRLQLEPEK